MSTRLTELRTADGSKIYIQYDEDDIKELSAVGFKENVQERTERFNEGMINTIRGYSEILLNTLQEGMAGVQAPERVTLEFGMQIGGETGVPFITKGTVNTNLKVTIEWNINSETQK